MTNRCTRMLLHCSASSPQWPIASGICRLIARPSCWSGYLRVRSVVSTTLTQIAQLGLSIRLDVYNEMEPTDQ